MGFKVDIKKDYRGDIRKYFRESKVFRLRKTYYES